jgi:hypothetical protein
MTNASCSSQQIIYLFSGGDNNANLLTSCERLVFNAGLAPTPLIVGLAPSSALSDSIGQSVRIPLQIHSNSCITTLRIRVSHDGDLLHYISVDSANVRLDNIDTLNGEEFFTITSPPDSGIVCNLQYRSFLTQNDTTPVTLSILSYDSTCMPCISSEDTQGSSVSIIYGCGGNTLRDFMSSGTFLVGRIAPNPACDAFQVSLAKPDDASVRYEIDDALGRFVAWGETSERTLSLSASGMAAGVYTFRASANGFAQARRFVVVK